MARPRAPRHAVYVWDADGDMGMGVVLGPFRTVDAAERKADSVRAAAIRGEADGYVQAVVIDLWPGSAGAGAVVQAVALTNDGLELRS